MDIAANTKISALIKANPDAVEAIASINRHFEKLRNPLLQKLLASRVTIADAARIGGCTEEEFYKRLEPLGFTHISARQVLGSQPETCVASKPAFLAQLKPANILRLDVREDISTGHDPFLKIMCTVEELDGTNALLLVNTFEPTPLISILSRRGYATYKEVKGPDLVYSYFWPKGEERETATVKSEATAKSFEELLAQFDGMFRHVDVRHLEMPQPMITILNELEQLPAGEALYVTHRRVPQFLLPQLEERGFALASKEIGPSELHLIIYKQK